MLRVHRFEQDCQYISFITFPQSSAVYFRYCTGLCLPVLRFAVLRWDFRYRFGWLSQQAVCWQYC